MVVLEQSHPTNYAKVGYIGKLTSIQSDGFKVEHPEMSDHGGSGCKKVRHATQKEINNHLSFTEQNMGIPSYPIRDKSTDDLSNYGLPTEPPSYMPELDIKQNPCKEVYSRGYYGDPIEPGKPKFILSVDDEELPMVNIIKTKTITKLLNN